MPTRRSFLKSTATATTLVGGGLGLGSVRRADAALPENAVQFANGIETLVREIEDTPREVLIETMARPVQSGLSYQKLLAALFLAGVRNVQPRPSVGFKFHAVLVVNSAHLASLASDVGDRWLPIFWALDNFKGSQARDVQEGNWTMSSLDDAKVPTAAKARGMFTAAMDGWDEEQADIAVAGLSRSSGANEIFELFARYGIRDFRSIGHKAIFVANSYRTLQCIGWHHSEPILRSLAYALQNHEGQPNPSQHDLEADRPWRENSERVTRLREDWHSGRLDSQATEALLTSFRSESDAAICDQIVEMLNGGVDPQSVYDAIFLAAGELLMRQPGIVALHAVTTTNAMNFAYRMAMDRETRALAILQNAAFLPMFREAMRGRGEVHENWITNLSVEGTPSVESVFTELRQNRQAAAVAAYSYLEGGGKAEELIHEARRLVFLKGRDSHDYKFSSAVLEDYHQVSPEWRSRFLASSVFRLRGSSDEDNGLYHRIKSALS